jgi:hypothetical protein
MSPIEEKSADQSLFSSDQLTLLFLLFLSGLPVPRVAKSKTFFRVQVTGTGAPWQRKKQRVTV